MMLMVAGSRFTTQMRPSGAIATLRGAAPTAISADFVFVTASKTLTVSLSWLTTQTREFAPLRVS